MTKDPDESPAASSETAIIGGQPVTANGIFATVALLHAREDANFACSGVLIAPTVVLTAGHCVLDDIRTDDPNALKVADPGRLAVLVNTLVPKGRSIPDNLKDVKAIHLHPDFDFKSQVPGLAQPNDLAVLELAMPVRTLEPIPVFPQAQLDSLGGDEPLMIAGYGCRGNGGPSGVLFEGKTFRYVVTPEFLYITGTPGTCPGDSGGPAYIVVEDRRWVLGIASGAGLMSFHAVASLHEAWIRSVTKGA